MILSYRLHSHQHGDCRSFIYHLNEAPITACLETTQIFYLTVPHARSPHQSHWVKLKCLQWNHVLVQDSGSVSVSSPLLVSQSHQHSLGNGPFPSSPKLATTLWVLLMLLSLWNCSVVTFLILTTARKGLLLLRAHAIRLRLYRYIGNLG